jgi:hypothetical protein
MLRLERRFDAAGGLDEVRDKTTPLRRKRGRAQLSVLNPLLRTAGSSHALLQSRRYGGLCNAGRQGLHNCNGARQIISPSHTGVG